jgi:hypothetical protein
MCPFGGIIIFDSVFHLGTFCADGNYILPESHRMNLGSNILIVTHYGLVQEVQISVHIRITVSRHIKGIINLCERVEEQTVWNQVRHKGDFAIAPFVGWLQYQSAVQSVLLNIYKSLTSFFLSISIHQFDTYKTHEKCKFLIRNFDYTTRHAFTVWMQTSLTSHKYAHLWTELSKHHLYSEAEEMLTLLTVNDEPVSVLTNIGSAYQSPVLVYGTLISNMCLHHQHMMIDIQIESHRFTKDDTQTNASPQSSNWWWCFMSFCSVDVVGPISQPLHPVIAHKVYSKQQIDEQIYEMIGMCGRIYANLYEPIKLYWTRRRNIDMTTLKQYHACALEISLSSNRSIMKGITLTLQVVYPSYGQFQYIFDFIKELTFHFTTQVSTARLDIDNSNVYPLMFPLTITYKYVTQFTLTFLNNFENSPYIPLTCKPHHPLPTVLFVCYFNIHPAYPQDVAQNLISELFSAISSSQLMRPRKVELNTKVVFGQFNHTTNDYTTPRHTLQHKYYILGPYNISAEQALEKCEHPMHSLKLVELFPTVTWSVFRRALEMKFSSSPRLLAQIFVLFLNISVVELEDDDKLLACNTVKLIQ